MPHVVLEHSANLLEQSTLPELFKKCHSILAEQLPTEVNSCISRAVECKTYLVGDGQPDKAFIHVTIKIKSGRTFETLQKANENLLMAIKDFCSESDEKFNLQISLEMVELQKTYFSKK